MWFESEGILLTDPPPDTWNGNDSSRWWAILGCDDDIGNYYRWLLCRRNWLKIMRPAWYTHVSIARGEQPTNEDTWFRMKGTKIRFSYENIVKNNETHFWLQVESQACLDFRKAVGLPESPGIPLHLTLGMIQPSSGSI